MYGPLMYFGPLNSEVDCNDYSTFNREDAVTTRITIEQQNQTMSWEFDDGSTITADIIPLLTDASGTTPKKPKRNRRRLTEDDYRRVAEAWRQAPEGGRNKAVRELLDTNRQNATNYINRARKLGFLAPTTARPIRAVQTESFRAEIEQMLASQDRR